MTETLREKEELSRIESENLRKAREEIAILRRKVDQHNELMAEKDRTAQVSGLAFTWKCNFSRVCQILHDEINTLQLELGQIEERNQILTKDNAKLLQRWLDAKQAEVNRMNEANEFYEDMQSRRQQSMSKKGSEGNGDLPPSTNESGNGESRRSSGPTTTKDGTPSRGEKDLNMTPNG